MRYCEPPPLGALNADPASQQTINQGVRILTLSNNRPHSLSLPSPQIPLHRLLLSLALLIIPKRRTTLIRPIKLKLCPATLIQLRHTTGVDFLVLHPAIADEDA